MECGVWSVECHFCRHMKMSGSAMPAMQMDLTTCCETLRKESIYSCPQRHGHFSLQRGIEQTRPNRQSPKVKREPFATHSGKKYNHGAKHV